MERDRYAIHPVVSAYLAFKQPIWNESLRLTSVFFGIEKSAVKLCTFFSFCRVNVRVDVNLKTLYFKPQHAQKRSVTSRLPAVVVRGKLACVPQSLKTKSFGWGQFCWWKLYLTAIWSTSSGKSVAMRHLHMMCVNQVRKMTHSRSVILRKIRCYISNRTLDSKGLRRLTCFTTQVVRLKGFNKPRSLFSQPRQLHTLLRNLGLRRIWSKRSFKLW